MVRSFTRRSVVGAPIGLVSVLGLAPLFAEGSAAGSLAEAAAVGSLAEESAAGSTVHPSFPAQDPQRVRDTVLYAHSDLDKVRALVSASPALANAAIDWGLGDWESAIGAAAHMGRRDMATVLLEYGARPDLFTHAMLGHTAAVRAIIEAQPGVQSMDGPHGITLLAHAKAGGDGARDVVSYLEQVGGADPPSGKQPLERPSSDYQGIYAWSSAPADRLEILETRFGLGLRRGEGFPRGLIHVGKSEFYPGGSRAVRVRFTLGEGRATAVTVVDGALRLVAERVAD